jgi:hypothetical protein
MKLSGIKIFIAAAVFGQLFGACRSRNLGGESEVLEVDTSLLRTKGLAVIDWSCSGTGKSNRSGDNSQEEYCEWNRKPQAFRGSGVAVTAANATDGKLDTIDVPRACVFTTAFDQSRQFYLTKQVLGQAAKKSDKAGADWATQFNSYAFLVGGTEPDTGARRDGIIGHCLSGKSCVLPDNPKEKVNCVPDRASDPQICRALNELGRKGCQVDTKYEIAPVVTASTVGAGRMGDQIVRPQLVVTPTLASKCWYVRDPRDTGAKVQPASDRTLVVCEADPAIAHCDGLADKVSVTVTLKVVNNQCVGGAGNTAADGAAGKVGTGGGVVAPGQLAANMFCKIQANEPANARPKPSTVDNKPRAQLPKGTEVFVRELVLDEVDGAARRWASIDLTIDGKAVGAGATPATPTFVAESQFRLNGAADGAVSCRPSN